MDRRTVLRGVGTIAAAGMLAGCSDGGDGGDGEDGGDTDAPTDTATATATATESGMSTPTEEDTATPTEEDTATPTEEETATPSGGDVPAEVQDYLSDVGNYDGTVQDMTGMDSVTIDVGAQGNGGAFAFAPAAVRIDPGTTVTWEWTGEGGQHNVVDEDGGFESALQESGSFEQTFDSSGSVRYFCQPHKSLGMKAAIIVTEGGGGEATATPTETETATATPAGTPQEVEDYLSDVGNYDGTVQDMTGMDSVTIDVGAQGNGGAFAFAPPAVRIDSGTTVTWEWTGEGGQHNVVDEDGGFESELKASGSFEQTFDSSGSVRYFCNPHKGLGMKAALIVE